MIRFSTPIRRNLRRNAAAALLLLGAWGLSVAADGVPPPFQIVWTRGACPHCRTAQGFGDVAYAAGKNLWALGYAAPGEEGSGTGTVLHSRDGGRRWRELGWTYTYPGAPLVSFASAREGWVAVPDAGGAAPRLMFTRNGSAWQPMPQRELPTAAIQYLGRGTGFAAVNANREPPRPAAFYAIRDHGRHWRQEQLPAGRLLIDQMRFVNARQGYIAGCLDRQLVSLATADAGRSWLQTQLPAPPGNPSGITCSLEIDGLLAAGDDEVWLLGVKRSFGIGDTQGDARVWRTADGGRTWNQIYRSSQTQDLEHFVSFSGPFALGARLIVLFKDTGDGKGEALTTADQGQHWTAAPLPRPMAGCVPTHSTTRPALVCAATTYPGFWLATLTLRD